MVTLFLILGLAAGFGVGYKVGSDKGYKKGLDKSFIIIDIKDALGMATDLRKNLKANKISHDKDMVWMDREEWGTMDITKREV